MDNHIPFNDFGNRVTNFEETVRDDSQNAGLNLVELSKSAGAGLLGSPLVKDNLSFIVLQHLGDLVVDQACTNQNAEQHASSNG